eukprot:4317224-Pleurochrysis_carterae.AAC.3
MAKQSVETANGLVQAMCAQRRQWPILVHGSQATNRILCPTSPTEIGIGRVDEMVQVSDASSLQYSNSSRSDFVAGMRTAVSSGLVRLDLAARLYHDCLKESLARNRAPQGGLKWI